MEAMLRQQVQASEHQVMAAAPTPIKKKYFADIAATKQLEAEKKRLKAELEHAELLIAKENAMSKLFELQARHVEELTDFSADFTPDPYDDDGVVEVIGASKTEDTVNEEGIIECSWPVCQGNIHPPENCRAVVTQCIRGCTAKMAQIFFVSDSFEIWESCQDSIH
jgi:hypothetical protein